MNKLKNLTQEDLDTISEFFSSTANDLILANLQSKEIVDLDIKIESSYNNEELDIDIDVNIDLDEFSKINNEDVELAISKSYSKLDDFIDDNYRI